jgi:hypothetical protein
MCAGALSGILERAREARTSIQKGAREMNPNQINIANLHVNQAQLRREASQSRLLARLRRR